MQRLKVVLSRMTKNPLLIVGLSIVVFYIIIGLLAPVLAPPTPGHDPFSIPQDRELLVLSRTPTPPSSTHILGTTADQFDLYYGCIWGTQTAFRVGLLATLGALAIGLLIGTVAGYFGGFVDEALSWVVNIFLALSVILALYMILSMPASLTRLDKLTVALILFGWPICANIVRSEILSIKYGGHFEEPEVVKASKAQVWRTYPALILRVACLQLGSAVAFGAAISFLGLGPSTAYADWGNLIQKAGPFASEPSLLQGYWYVYVFPGIFLFTFILGWILLGEGIKRIIEDRMEKRIRARQCLTTSLM